MLRWATRRVPQMGGSERELPSARDTLGVGFFWYRVHRTWGTQGAGHAGHGRTRGAPQGAGSKSHPGSREWTYGAPVPTCMVQGTRQPGGTARSGGRVGSRSQAVLAASTAAAQLRAGGWRAVKALSRPHPLPILCLLSPWPARPEDWDGMAAG